MKKAAKETSKAAMIADHGFQRPEEEQIIPLILQNGVAHDIADAHSDLRSFLSESTSAGG